MTRSLEGRAQGSRKRGACRDHGARPTGEATWTQSQLAFLASTGTSGADTVTGAAGDDVFGDRGGGDTITGGNGSDTCLDRQGSLGFLDYAEARDELPLSCGRIRGETGP